MNNSAGNIARVSARLEKRHRAERRFRVYGLITIILGLAFLSLLFISIVGKGYTAFQQTYVRLPIAFDAGVLDPDGNRDPEVLSRADYGSLVKDALKEIFPEVSGRREKRALYSLVSTGAAFQLREMVLADSTLIGSKQEVWVPADDDVDMLMKDRIDREAPESDRRLKDNQLAWIEQLIDSGRIEKRFNSFLFTNGDSREPELAGIRGAAMGSFSVKI